LTDFNLAGGALLVRATPSVPTSYFFSGVLRHQLTRNWQLILSGSHDLIFTTGTNLTEENIVGVGTQMNLTRFITFTASPFVNFGDVKSGANSGNFTQYGIVAGLGWKPHRRWSTRLTYDFVRRNGTTASDSYIQNTVTLQVSYRF
jgi:opacity protein-like surface antigen